MHSYHKHCFSFIVLFMHCLFMVAMEVPLTVPLEVSFYKESFIELAIADNISVKIPQSWAVRSPLLAGLLEDIPDNDSEPISLRDLRASSRDICTFFSLLNPAIDRFPDHSDDEQVRLFALAEFFQLDDWFAQALYARRRSFPIRTMCWGTLRALGCLQDSRLDLSSLALHNLDCLRNVIPAKDRASIQALDVSRNALTSINISSICHLLPNVERIDVSYNPLTRIDGSAVYQAAISEARYRIDSLGRPRMRSILDRNIVVPPALEELEQNEATAPYVETIKTLQDMAFKLKELNVQGISQAVVAAYHAQEKARVESALDSPEKKLQRRFLQGAMAVMAMGTAWYSAYRYMDHYQFATDQCCASGAILAVFDPIVFGLACGLGVPYGVHYISKTTKNTFDDWLRTVRTVPYINNGD